MWCVSVLYDGLNESFQIKFRHLDLQGVLSDPHFQS